MNRRIFFKAVLVLAIAACSATLGQADDRAVRYISTEIGFNQGQGFDFFGSSSDQGSVCDPVINPDASSRAQAGCPTQGTGWLSKFDSAKGISASVAVGFALDSSTKILKNVRYEVEYNFRHTPYRQATPILSRSGVTRDKLSDEIHLAQERIGDATEHSFFFNAYLDFPSTSQYTPYIGLGIGYGAIVVDNGRVWVRNIDWRQIRTGSGLPNETDIRRTLAGSTSSVQTSHKDSKFGYQLIAGVDYEFNDSLTFGIKARYLSFGELEDVAGLDVLRSHEPPPGYTVQRELDAAEHMTIGLYLKTRL